MTRMKTILRRLRTLLWTAFSIVVILAAVLVGLGKLLMPYSDYYQPRLEAWLSEEFGRPVEIGSFEGDWTAFGPRLTLQDMKLLPRQSSARVLEPTADVVIESAALDIKPLNALLPGLPLYNFRIIGASFELLHTRDGEFRLSGFGVSRRDSGAGDSALKELARIGEVVLQDSTLEYRDERHGIEIGFTGIEGRLHLDGENLSTEVQARLFDQRSELVYGEVKAFLTLTLDEDEKIAAASWQASLDDLMLASLQGKIPENPLMPLTGWLNAELWGDWSKAEGHFIRGSNDLEDAWLINEHQDLSLSQLSYRFRWHFKNTADWGLHTADLLFDDGDQAWVVPRMSLLRRVDDDLGLWISADQLPLGIPLKITRDVMSIYGTEWPQSLPGASDGRVRNLEVGLNSRWRLKFARGEIMDASIGEWGDWPGLQGLNGSVNINEHGGAVFLEGEDIRIDWPRMFRDPITVGLAGCRVDLRLGEHWQTRIEGCRLENTDAAVEADLTIVANTGKPSVDVNTVVLRGDVAALDKYWPEALLPGNVKQWLRRGLLDGDLASGRLQIFGDMDDFPFRHGEGRFEAVAEVENGHIDFLDGWPEATGVRVTARFVGAGMDLRGTVGELGGVSVHSVTAGIADMKQPVLEIDYATESQTPRYLEFIKQTPLLEPVDLDFDRFTFQGPARSEGRIVIPLGSTPGDLSINGRASFADNLFSDPDSEVTLENVNGDIRFTEQGFSGRDLAGTFHGQAASLDLVSVFEGEEKFRADLKGLFSAASLIPGFLADEFLALSNVAGSCDWDISLVVRQAGTAPSEAELVLRSELGGVTLNLPAPMNKRVGERWPFLLRMPLTGDSRPIDVLFEERASMRFDMPGDGLSARRAVIHLGDGVAVLPPEGFIRLEGESDQVDLDGWVDIIIDEATRGTGIAGLSLDAGSLQADSLRFLNRQYDNVSMEFEVENSEVTARFTGEDITGTIRFKMGDSGMNSLSAEFDRLVMGDPIQTGDYIETDPSDLPAMHLYVKSFSYTGVELGETRIEAFPTATGFHFEMVDASSDRLSLQASGDWFLDELGERSDFDIHLASESLGGFLESLDFSSAMQGGQTLVDFKAWWPGSPAAFGLPHLNGQVEFSVVNGNISNASAGGGRLLGLLSIQALPKRLILDFRDVFDSGFSFDEATGSFSMENGMATTEDVLLKSTSAKIMVSGKTDLVAQEYDQLLTIMPGVGNTLPIIGALAAGPGGAAAGLALQGLLHDELAEATQVRYTIKGHWDDPQFEPVDVVRSDG